MACDIYGVFRENALLLILTLPNAAEGGAKKVKYSAIVVKPVLGEGSMLGL